MAFIRSASAIRAPLMAFLAMGAFWGSWHALVPDVKRAVGADDGELGLTLLFVALGAVPDMMFGGRMADRMGAILLPVSVLVFGVSAILPALARSPFELGAALLVLGIASGLMDVVMNACVGAIEAATGVRAMHLAHGMFAVVYLAATLLTGIAREGGAEPLAVLSCVAATGTVLALVALVLGGEDRTADAAIEEPKDRQFDVPVVLLGVIAFTAFLAENGWQSWSAPFLERTFDATASLASMGPAAVGLALVVGRFGAQVLASRTDDRTLIAGAVGRGRFRSDVARSWLANTSLFVDASAHRTNLIARRGVHQVYVGTDSSNDACHAVPVEPIAYGFIENMTPSMREAFRLGAHVVKTEQHRRGSSRRAGIGAAGPTCLDAFAERLMTPMRDAGGRVVGGLRDPVRVHAPA